MADADAGKRRTFRKFSYRGVDLDQLLDMNTDDLVELFHARARRRYRLQGPLILLLQLGSEASQQKLLKTQHLTWFSPSSVANRFWQLRVLSDSTA